MMVGRLIGADALGAVGNAGSAAIVFVAISGGIEMGIQIVFSRYNIKTQRKDLLNATLVVAVIDVVLGGFLTILAFLQSHWVMDVMRVHPSLYAMSESYFQIYVLGIAFIFLYDGGRAILIGCGDSKSPFYLVLVTSLINVLLDYLMIQCLKMGVKGAAMATVLSQVIGFLLTGWILSKKLWVKGSEVFYFDKALLYMLVKVAFPSMCQQLTLSLFAFAMQVIINGLGAAIVAGYTAAAKVSNVYMMAIIGFSQGFAMMASRKIGENKSDEISVLYQAALKNCLIYDTLLVVMILLFAEQFVAIFFDGTSYMEAFGFACNYLRIMSLLIFLFTLKYLNEDWLKSGMLMKEFLCSNFSEMLVRLFSCSFTIPWLGAYGLCFSSLLGALVSYLISKTLLSKHFSF